MISCVYPNLLALMAEKKVSINDMARAIGRNPETVRKKLAGKYPFDLDEALTVQDEWFEGVPLRILYARRAQVLL